MSDGPNKQNAYPKPTELREPLKMQGSFMTVLSVGRASGTTDVLRVTTRKLVLLRRGTQIIKHEYESDSLERSVALRSLTCATTFSTPEILAEPESRGCGGELKKDG
jgi:hypothetical protein